MSNFIKKKTKLIIGPMFSGKTTKLIKIIKYFNKKNKKILVFKPEVDNRKGKKYIVCHNNLIYSVNVVKNSNEILEKIKEKKNIDIVFFSEVQFFDDNYINIIKKLLLKNISLYFGGLSLDFQKKTFKIIEELKKIVNKIEYRFAGCYKCFQKAPFSKRIVKENSKILIGGKEFYIPVCKNCFK